MAHFLWAGAVLIKPAFPPGVTRIIWKAGDFHDIFNIAADRRIIERIREGEKDDGTDVIV